MFYLKQFFFLFKKYPLRWVSFTLLFFFFLFSLFNRPKLMDILHVFFGAGKPRAFFTAVMIDYRQDPRVLKDKLLALPGVEAVELAEDAVIKNQVTQSLEKSVGEIPDLFLRQKVLGLKIFFKVNVVEKSIELIREYLVRMAGKESITLSEILYDRPRYAIDQYFSWRPIEDWGDTFFYIFLSVAIFGLYLSLRGPINLLAYIVEEYQSKRLVAVKISFTALSILYFTSSLFLFFVTDFSWKGHLWAIILMSFLPLTHLKYSYESMEKY